MASYDEMKEAARREALGEQASKFYEMTRTPRMFQTAGEVAPPPSRDPLAGLPVDPERAASLDARYAEVDRHLAAATAARARIPKGAEVEGPGDSTPSYRDKYGYGVAGAWGRYSGTDTPYIPDDSYGELEALEKRGLISIQPGMRAEMARVRGQAKGQTAAMNEERKATNEAYRVSPLGEQVRGGRASPEGLRRPAGDGPYSEPKKK
jgi:hypothetical protein